jgi:glycosyltransferase involved in cell wall biosynthesis
MAAKTKLVYVLHDIEIGGMEVALLSAVPSLNKKFDLSIIAIGHINYKLIAHFSSEDQKVFKAFGYPLYLMPFKIKNIVKYIKGLSPDKLICSLWRASWIGFKMKKVNPDLFFFSFIHSTKFFHIADAFFTRKALNIADTILVDSSSSSSFVKKHLVRNTKIVDISFLTHTTPSDNPTLNKEISFKQRAVRFLFMGRIFKVKNLPFTIRFISSLRQRGYNISLDIYGRKGNDYKRCLKLIRKFRLNDIVQFKGEINPQNRFDIYKQYDFYIQFSKFEGMAMSVVEAMQNGLVCIVTPVGEIPHYAQDGESAIFVDYRSKEAWEDSLQKVERVMNDNELYAQLSNNCFHNFSEKICYADSLIENI